jgi:S-formylglutathione hydrolase FrmB
MSQVKAATINSNDKNRVLRATVFSANYTMRIAASLLLALIFSFTASGQSVAAAARFETVQFQSKLIGKTLPYNVLLPSDYASTQTTRYPVLYLLHGLFGHYSDWFTKTKLAAYATQHRLIIVTPEGNNSWYTDSATVPADKYETYIMRELIPDVQSRYRTIEGREGRAIAGLSMGGYGALKFGVKYPDQFSFAASMSGALAAATWTDSELRKAEFARPSVVAAFGSLDNPTRVANDLFKLFREFPAERLSTLPYFYLDCGTEDMLLMFNRSLAAIFLERKIPHEFRELPGQHNWKFWDAQVRDVLRIAEEHLTPPQTGLKSTRASARAQTILTAPVVPRASEKSFLARAYSGD